MPGSSDLGLAWNSLHLSPWLWSRRLTCCLLSSVSNKELKGCLRHMHVQFYYFWAAIAIPARINLKNKKKQLVVLVPTCNPNTREAEAGGWWEVQGLLSSSSVRATEPNPVSNSSSEWEKIFANYASDMGLISRINKELQKLSIQPHPNYLIRNGLMN